jgi:YggT family protein
LEQIESFIWLLHRIYSTMLIIYVVMSWLPSVKESFIGELLGKMVDPYLTPFRRLIPPIGGIIDITPIVAYFSLSLVAQGLVTVLGLFIK